MATDLTQARPQPSRSIRLLVFAAAITAVTVVAGSAIIWSLFSSTSIAADVGTSAAFHASAQPLTVGIGRTPGGPREWIAYAAVFAQVERELQRPVAFSYAATRQSSACATMTDQADLAFVSTECYLTMSAESSVTLIASPVIEGRERDSAVAVVAADSPYNRFDELRGMHATLTLGSLAGEGFPHWLLAGQREDVGTFFGTVEYAESQNEALESLARDAVTVVFVRRSDLAPWPAGRFRVIEESPEFGMPPIIACENLDERETELIRQALLDAAAKGVIPSGSSLTGFTTVDDSDYAFSRTLRRTVPEAASESQAGTE